MLGEHMVEAAVYIIYKIQCNLQVSRLAHNVKAVSLSIFFLLLFLLKKVAANKLCLVLCRSWNAL